MLLRGVSPFLFCQKLGRQLGSISRTLLFAAVLLACAVVAARLALPTFVQRYVNRTLNRIPDFRGHIGAVDLHLIRGAYSIRDVKLERDNGRVPVPLFSAPLVDLSIEWGALLHGKVVGRIYLEHPVLNFVNARSKSSSQLSVNDEWLSAVKDLFPLRINRFEVHLGELHFRDFESSPPVNVLLTKVEAIGTNFSNTRTPSKDSMARIDLSALAEDSSKVSAKAEIQPAAREPTFKIQGAIEGLEVKSLNDLLDAYAAVSASSGTIDIYTEMVAEDGGIHGYVKPLVKDLSIKKLRANPLELLWSNITALLAEIVTNQRHNQLGTNVTFSGSIENPNIGVWSTIGEMLRNAFVKALKPGSPDTVQFEAPKPPVPTPEPTARALSTPLAHGS